MGITEIAMGASFIFIGGFATAAIMGQAGYGFDLRRKQRDRRKDPNRNGGRRDKDEVLAA